MRKSVCTIIFLIVAIFGAGAGAVAGAEVAKPTQFAKCAEALATRREAVKSVVARLHVTLHDRAKSKDFELNGAYIGDAAGNMRLRVTTESGQLILDMGMSGENVEICIPGKSRYFYGTREELLESPRCELTLLAHSGRARDLFFPNAAPRLSSLLQMCQINGRAYCNMSESAAILPRYLMRLTLDLQNAVVEQKEYFSRGGLDAGSVAYTNYRFPEKDAAQAKPAYPGRVTLHVPGDAFVLDLEIEDLSLNTTIAPGKFAIPVPDGFQREKLAEALEKKLSIWQQ